MFPLNVASIGKLNVAVTSQTAAELWHLRLGHLNYRSMQLMAHKRMAFGLPMLKQDSDCEECVLAIQSRNSFPVEWPEEQSLAFNWCIWTYVVP